MKEFSKAKRFNGPTTFFRQGVSELQLPNSGKIHIAVAHVLADRFFLLFFLIWFLPLLLTTIFAFFSSNSLPNQIPLFYSRIWGERQLASSAQIFVPLAGAFFFGVTNILVSVWLYGRDKVLSYTLAGAASLVSILASITTFNIVNLFR